MSMSMLTGLVCFVVCHSGPADHTAAYAKVLKQTHEVQVYAAQGVASNKLYAHDVEHFKFSLEQLSSQEEDILAKALLKNVSMRAL